jgi:hypothetical protein
MILTGGRLDSKLSPNRLSQAAFPMDAVLWSRSMFLHLFRRALITQLNSNLSNGAGSHDGDIDPALALAIDGKPNGSVNVTMADSEIVGREGNDDATTQTSTTSTTQTSTQKSLTDSTLAKGTIMLLVGPPANVDDLDPLYDILIEVRSDDFHSYGVLAFNWYSHDSLTVSDFPHPHRRT